jgi:hypothetical protein
MSSLGISSLPPTCNPNFSFMGGVGKKKLVTKTLDVRNMFAGSHTEPMVEMLLCMSTSPKPASLSIKKNLHLILKYIHCTNSFSRRRQ